MNPPTPAPTPEQAAATELLRQKLAHALEQKRSREVNHMLKGASFRPHQPRRSTPHVRGR